jgi:cellobiose-specific phosphotransferase system component IIC
MRYFFGPIVFVLGVLMMKYSVKLTEFTGTVAFAEKYLRAGLAGTYTWYKLLGLFFCILSVLWTFGILDFSFVETVVTGVGE